MGQWSYATLNVHNVEIAALNERLRVLGEDGWELVTSVAPNKVIALVGNSLLFVFKKPGAGHAPPVFSDAGSEMLF